MTVAVGTTPRRCVTVRGVTVCGVTVLLLTLCQAATPIAVADRPIASGLPPLHQAVFDGDVTTVRSLLDAGLAELNRPTPYGVTPLSIAATAGDAAMIRVLIDAGADVEQTIAGEVTPLMLAARSGSADGVTAMLDAGADVDARQAQDQTALMWAASQGHVAVMQRLIDAGADIDATLASGFTPLLFAVREGRIESVQRLIDAGADVNAVMKPKRQFERGPRDRMSPLMIAVESGHFELALVLIDLGADPNDQRSGYGPLHALTWVRRAELGDNPAGDPVPRGSGGVDSLTFVERFVAAGGDVDMKLRRGNGGEAKFNPRGATPLLMAAHTADVPLMKCLVELGADPLAVNHEGTTAVMAAAGIGVQAVGEYPGSVEEVEVAIRYLIDLGVDVNAVDDLGQTAMHGAAYRSYPETITLLGLLGGDRDVWNRPNAYGHTPRMIAQGKRPGSFKPSPQCIAAIDELLGD